MKRTALALALLLTLLISSMPVVHPAKSSTKTIVVPDDFPTIQAALSNASAGDTVYVRAGNYNVTTEGYFSGIFHGFTGLSIDKSISLIGENCQNTVLTATIDWLALGNPFDCGIVVNADNVTISGFTIIGTTNVISLGDNSRLTNNIIELNDTGNGFVAVRAGSGGDIVSSNIIEGGGNRARANEAILTESSATISNNIIRNFERGIVTARATFNPSIFYNTFVNNSVGLDCLTIPALFYGNNIENCSQYSIHLDTSENVNATYNYWGTTNSQEISRKIFDNKNDSNLGTVTFEPFLTQPNPNATPSANLQTPQCPSPLISAILAASIAAVSVGLLVYFKKRRRQSFM